MNTSRFRHWWGRRDTNPPVLRNMAWSDCEPREQLELRDMLEQYADYLGSGVFKSRPPKGNLTHALQELAKLFAALSGKATDISSLPHSESFFRAVRLGGAGSRR